jgi:hypothetical protein
MCPICISAAAMAAVAGTGSASGLAALVAVKLRLKRQPESARAIREIFPKLNLQPQQAGGGK